MTRSLHGRGNEGDLVGEYDGYVDAMVVDEAVAMPDVVIDGDDDNVDDEVCDGVDDGDADAVDKADEVVVGVIVAKSGVVVTAAVADGDAEWLGVIEGNCTSSASRRRLRFEGGLDVTGVLAL